MSGSGTEVTLNIKGKADPAEIERLKALMEQLAPVLANAFQGVAPAAEAAAAAVDKAGIAAAGTADGAGKAASGFAGLVSSLGPVGTAIAGVVAGAAAMGTALAGATAAAIAMGKDSSAAFATIANKTGETGEALAGMEESLRHVSAGSAASMGDIASAMGSLAARTDLTGSSLEAMTKQQLALAKVTGTDVNQNIVATTRLFGDWGVATEQQAGKLDMMFRASQQSGVGVDRLSQLVVQFGAPMRNFGFSLEESAAMLGQFERQGVNTELVMGSLRIASGKFANAGIDLREGLQGAIVAIQQAGSTSEASALAMEVFGARAGSDMADTIRGGKFEINDWVKSLKEGTNTISGAADNAAGLSGVFAKAKNAFVSAVSPMTDLAFDLATKITGSVIPAVTTMSTWLGDKLAPMADWAREKIMPLVEMIGPMLSLAADSLIGAVQNVVGIFSDLGAGVGDSVGGMDGARSMMMNLGTVVLLLADYIKSLTGYLRDHAPSWDQIKAAAAGLMPILAGVAVGIMAVLVPALVAGAAAAISFIAPFLAGVAPFVLAGVAIGAFVALVVYYWDEIKAASQTLWDFLAGIFSGAYDVIAGAFSGVYEYIAGVFSSVGQFFGGFWETVKSVFGGVVDTVSEALGAARDILLNWVAEHQTAVMVIISILAMLTAPLWLPVVLVAAMVGAIKAHWGDIAAATSALVTAIGGYWDALVAWVGGLVDSLVAWVGGAWDTMVSWVTSATQALADAVAAAWAWIRETVVGIVTGFLTWLVGAWTSFYTWIVGVKNRLALAFAKAWGWIGQTVSTLVKGLVDWLVSGWNKLLTWFGQFFNTLGAGFAKAWAWIRKTVADIVGPILEWLVKAWHSAGKFIGGLLDTLGDAVARAWSSIKETFKAVAMPILNGMAGMFGRIAELARDGMKAAGDVIGGALGKIAEAFASFFGALGLTDIGSKFTGVMSTVRGVMDSISSTIGSAVSRMKGGLGDIASLFGDKVSGARDKVAGLFGGGPGSIFDKLGAADSGGSMGLDLSGQALDVGALKGGEGGGGGKGPLEVGDSSADGLGEFYIGDDGSKVYTSGAGLARQEAKEKKRADKEAERAAKKAAGKSKSGAGDSAEQKDKAKQAGDLAKEMSDVAAKVADAITSGLNAMADLRDADIPGRDVWEPRLAALQGFITGALQSFQTMGKGLLVQVKTAEDGTAILDESNARMAESAADVGGSMVDTLAKTAGFLASITKAKFPDQEKIDSVFGMATGLLVRVQDKALEMSKAFGPVDEKGESPAAKQMAASGQALGVWADITLKMADAARTLGDNAKALGVAPAALATVQAMLSSVQTMGQAVTDGIRAAVPDDLERDDLLGLSKTVASAMGAWVDVVVRLGAGADALRRLAKAPDVRPQVDRFFSMIGDIGGAMVTGLRAAIPNAAKRDEALDLSQAVAATMAAWLAPVSALAAAAGNLRRVSQIPDGTVAIIGQFWKDVSAVGAAIYAGMAKIDPTEQLQALQVSQALSGALGAAVGVVSSTATALRGLVDVPALPEGLMTKVQKILADTSAMLLTFLVGPGFNLLADVKGTIEQFGVTQALVKTFQDAISLVGMVASLGKSLVDMAPVTPAAVAQALANAGLVRDLVTQAADLYAHALDRAGILWEDVQEKIAAYSAVLKDALGAFAAAASLKLGEVLPIDPAAVQLALDNASLVESLVRAMADKWFSVIDGAGSKVADVVARMRDFGGYLKDALGVAAAALSIKVGEVLPLDPAALRLALDNAVIAVAMVDEYAAAWLAALALAKRKTVDVLQAVKDYSALVKDALGAAAAAAGFAIAEIEVLDPAKLEIAMANAGKVVGSLQAWADSWVKWIKDQGRKLEEVIGEGRDYAAYVKSAMEAVTAGAVALDDVPALDASGLARIMANIGLIVESFGTAAADWAARLISGGRDLDVVAAEAKNYGDVVGSAADGLGKVAELFAKLAGKPPTRAQGDAVNLLVDYITAIVQDLARAYDVIESEAGNLKKAGDVAAVVSPAAEAVAKVLDAISLDKLLKTPLVDTKIRSGFAAGVAARRMAYLGEQISAGIRRTVKALLDGLSGLTVPEGLETPLDRLAGAYERIIAVLERINDLSTPDPAKIRQLAALAALMVAALQAEGFQGGGAAAGQTVERPGDVGAPPPAAEPGPLGSTIVPGGAGARRPVVPGPPGNGSGVANVTIHLTQPVQLDGETLATAVETVITRKNLKTTTAPSGTG